MGLTVTLKSPRLHSLELSVVQSVNCTIASNAPMHSTVPVIPLRFITFTQCTSATRTAETEGSPTMMGCTTVTGFFVIPVADILILVLCPHESTRLRRLLFSAVWLRAYLRGPESVLRMHDSRKFNRQPRSVVGLSVCLRKLTNFGSHCIPPSSATQCSCILLLGSICASIIWASPSSAKSYATSVRIRSHGVLPRSHVTASAFP